MWVQGTGYSVQGTGYRVQGTGYRVQGTGYRVQGTGYRVQGTVYSWFCLSFFFTPPSVRDSHHVLASCLPPLSEKHRKIAPVLRNLASSVKLRTNDFLFLVFLHITTDGNMQSHQAVSTYLKYCVHFGLPV